MEVEKLLCGRRKKKVGSPKLHPLVFLLPDPRVLGPWQGAHREPRPRTRCRRLAKLSMESSQPKAVSSVPQIGTTNPSLSKWECLFFSGYILGLVLKRDQQANHPFPEKRQKKTHADESCSNERGACNLNNIRFGYRQKKRNKPNDAP